MNRITTNIKLIRHILLQWVEVRNLVDERIVPFAFKLSSDVDFPFIVINIDSVKPFQSFDDDDNPTREFEITVSAIGADPEAVTNLADECIVALEGKNQSWNIDGEDIFIQQCRLIELRQQTPRPSEGEETTTDFIFGWDVKFRLTTTM